MNVFKADLFHLDNPNLIKEIDKKRLQQELNQARKLAFYGVAVLSVAILVALFLIPFLYSHLQFVQSLTNYEIAFCKSRINNVWKELRTEVNI